MKPKTRSIHSCRCLEVYADSSARFSISMKCCGDRAYGGSCTRASDVCEFWRQPRSTLRLTPREHRHSLVFS